MFASRPPIVVNLSQTRPVVVGVSEKQPPVIRYALAEASRLGTGLRVVHCYTLHA